jgi:hypothetical protein
VSKRKRSAVAVLNTRFYDPNGGVFRGREEIDRVAGVIKATHPDFEYQPLSPPDERGDAGRVPMGIRHSGQTTSLRGNRFYRRPERSHCFGLSLFRQSSLTVVFRVGRWHRIGGGNRLCGKRFSKSGDDLPA